MSDSFCFFIYPLRANDISVYLDNLSLYTVQVDNTLDSVLHPTSSLNGIRPSRDIHCHQGSSFSTLNTNDFVLAIALPSYYLVRRNSMGAVSTVPTILLANSIQAQPLA